MQIFILHLSAFATRVGERKSSSVLRKSVCAFTDTLSAFLRLNVSRAGHRPELEASNAKSCRFTTRYDLVPGAAQAFGSAFKSGVGDDAGAALSVCVSSLVAARCRARRPVWSRMRYTTVTIVPIVAIAPKTMPRMTPSAARSSFAADGGGGGDVAWAPRRRSAPRRGRETRGRSRGRAPVAQQQVGRIVVAGGRARGRATRTRAPPARRPPPTVARWA